MKNKTLKKILIEKSENVHIPDIKEQIKARFDEIPPKPMKQPVFSFRKLAIVMTASFTLLMVAVIGVVYFSSDPDPLVMEDDSLHDAVMLSSISTLSVIENIEDTSSHWITLLANGPQHGNNDEETEDAEINYHVDTLRKYLNMTESLMTSEHNFQYQKRILSRRGRRVALQFAADSLTEEKRDYELVYEVTNENDQNIEMTASITTEDESYQTEITYQKENKGITMKTAMNNHQSLEISYHKTDEERHYQITAYDGLMIQEQVTLTYQHRETIMLSVSKDDHFANYTIGITTGPLGRRNILSIDYDIQDQYQGNIKLSVNQDDNEQYIMIITPNGRPSFIVTNPRGRGRN